MGFLEGAVQGMVGRLMPVGFLPWEAQCLAEAAYLKPDQISVGFPKPLRKRSEVSHLINRGIQALSLDPFGSRGHLGRIALWESIFGVGSWPEQLEYTPEQFSYVAEFHDSLVGDLGAVRQEVPQVAAEGLKQPEIRLAEEPSPMRQHSSWGQRLYIFVGVCAILFAGLFILMVTQGDIGPSEAADILPLIPGGFGMLSIGGAAASGVNTQVSKVMMLIACFFMLYAVSPVRVAVGGSDPSVDVFFSGILFVIMMFTGWSIYLDDVDLRSK